MDRNFRRVKVLLIVWIFGLFLTGCGQDDFVIRSLPTYVHKEFYKEGGFQDFTDYGIYTFDSFDGTKLEENVYFEKIMDVRVVLPYIENFESWLTEGTELAENYHFDKAWLDESDYLFVDTEEGNTIGNSDRTYGKFDNYDVYFFDTNTWTLYYFHNNI